MNTFTQIKDKDRLEGSRKACGNADSRHWS